MSQYTPSINSICKDISKNSEIKLYNLKKKKYFVFKESNNFKKFKKRLLSMDWGQHSEAQNAVSSSKKI
jgi:hypothetical protein